MVEIANFITTEDRAVTKRSLSCRVMSTPRRRGSADISDKAWEWTVYSVVRLWRAPTMINRTSFHVFF